MVSIINEALSLSIALSAGIYAFRYMNRFTRILFYQLITWICFYLGSYALTTYQENSNIEPNDHWLLNIHLLLEALWLTVAAYNYSNAKTRKSLALILYGVFLIVFTIQVSVSGFSCFANLGMAAAGLMITILYLFILYDAFRSKAGLWYTSPEIWACIGLVIYFACNVPYFSLFTYLNDHYPILSGRLFSVITDVLANIRYFFLAIAFFIAARTKAVSTVNPHGR
ncbi:MAG: hypothetical protein JWO09_1745 [Bacteroidetes bacterium]|nr:hypothetical protein [Bacteroidota bacterium]